MSFPQFPSLPRTLRVTANVGDSHRKQSSDRKQWNIFQLYWKSGSQRFNEYDPLYCEVNEPCSDNKRTHVKQVCYSLAAETTIMFER